MLPPRRQPSTLLHHTHTSPVDNRPLQPAGSGLSCPSSNTSPYALPKPIRVGSGVSSGTSPVIALQGGLLSSYSPPPQYQSTGTATYVPSQSQNGNGVSQDARMGDSPSSGCRQNQNNTTYYYYKEEGHFANSCPKKNGNNHWQGSGSGNGGRQTAKLPPSESTGRLGIPLIRSSAISVAENGTTRASA